MRVGPLLPRRQTMRPAAISASAMSSATHTGKPVKGSVPPATFATLPSTPPAGFDFVIVAFAPSTPLAFCDGEAFDEPCRPRTGRDRSRGDRGRGDRSRTGVTGAGVTGAGVTGAGVTGAGVTGAGVTGSA